MTTSSSHAVWAASPRDAARPLRVACVYPSKRSPSMAAMDGIRFVRMAEALARRGYEVDIFLNRVPDPKALAPRLRELSLGHARWDDYDVVKTFFHSGFEALVAHGGGEHPFIVSKLGSVVGREQTEGVYFFGAMREGRFEVQREIARRSRVVTVLTNQSAALWWKEHGCATQLMQVPTGVDAEIPPLGPNPYPGLGITEPVAIFAGNLYDRRSQPEINRLWQAQLNLIGARLRRRGVRLVAMGDGETDLLDAQAVQHVGQIETSAFWNWQRHARVGIVLAQGPVQDNESSKIYYYLRTGLPVVCERSVPNAWLIETTGMGAVVDFGETEQLAESAAALARVRPRIDGVVQHMVRYHSWDARAALYDQAFASARARRASGA
jgi:hypothetical protein